MLTGTIQELLHQTMGAASSGTGNARGPVIQIDSTAYQVDGCVLPAMGNGIALPFNFKAFGADQASIAELLKEGE